MIYIKNTKEKQTIYIPRTELYTEQYVNPVKTYEEGYNDGFDKGVDKGIDEQKSKLETIVINNNGIYEREDGYNKVIVEYQDLNGSYNDGYADGKNDGIQEQKSRLESITITENGSYIKEDGYNEITVNVEDTNGSYDEGYADGKNDGYNEGKEDGFSDGYNEGYDVGYTDGGDNQKSKLESITITENGSYSREDGYSNIEVNVPDLNGSFDEGYSEGYDKGKNDGIDEQKSKLESISITENGTYSREDGYNEIVVEVPDVNGSYDDGYSEGYDKGKDDGYAEGIEEGVNNAGEIIAQTAQVLDVTENGIYTTKYSNVDLSGMDVTGYFDDGTPYYNYALLIGKGFKTDVKLNKNSKIEIWWKPDLSTYLLDDRYIFCKYRNNDDIDINLGYNDRTDSYYGSGKFFAKFFNTQKYYENIADKWYHFVLSVNDGFVVDDVKIDDIIGGYTDNENYGYINFDMKYNRNLSNGYFGMIKIDGNTYIPTENGYINYATNTPLEVVKDGFYSFSDVLNYTGDNLIKTVNVNVQPKINVAKENIKFGYSNFSEIPEYYDFDSVADTSYMFYNCSSLTTIPQLDTSKVTTMTRMFYNCSSLTTIPPIDTSKVTSMAYMFYNCSNLITIPQLDTSEVTTMERMFYYCGKLTTIPPIDTSKVTSMAYMFYYCNSLESLPALNLGSISSTSNINRFFYNTITNLTDIGGFLDLKVSWNDNYGLKVLPNLTYQSCINVLNGLYDFTSNGETPSSSQGKLKVHANFLTTVGDEISIGTNKGWTITS